MTSGHCSNEATGTAYQVEGLPSYPSVIADFESLMTKIYGSSRAPIGFLTSSSDLGDSLTSPISALPGNATRTELSFRASLFLSRKALIPSPGNRTQILSAYISKMGRVQTASPSFVAHVDRMVDRLFPFGWDSRYVAYCSRTLPSSGASFGTGRKHGGARAEIRSKYSRSEFVTACSTGFGVSIDSKRKVTLVTDNGKARVVTIADACQSVLAPLHHLMYDHLARRKWLLRGEATANSFKEFTREGDEVFVSGDYESATDNFNVHHSKAILSAMLNKSRNIPGPIKQLALASLTGTLVVDGVAYPQLSGQLMGNLLSFPLLCITNYLAFKWLIPRDVPCRINGDDIVFRARLAEAERWMKGVQLSGLTLSKGKTLVHRRYFSLNSTFFEGRYCRKPSLIPVVRAKCLYAPLQKGDGPSLAARLVASCKGMVAWAKVIVKSHILRWHRRSARAVGCSFNRGLGVRVPYPALVESGFLEQESFYLRLPAGMDNQRKQVYEHGEDRLPATHGWRTVPRSRARAEMSADGVKNLEVMWSEHCLNHAWTVRFVDTGDKTFEPVRVGFEPLGNLWGYARLCKITSRALWRWLGAFSRKHPSVKRWLYDGTRKRSAPDLIWVTEAERICWKAPPTFSKPRILFSRGEVLEDERT